MFLRRPTISAEDFNTDLAKLKGDGSLNVALIDLHTALKNLKQFLEEEIQGDSQKGVVAGEEKIEQRAAQRLIYASIEAYNESLLSAIRIRYRNDYKGNNNVAKFTEDLNNLAAAVRATTKICQEAGEPGKTIFCDPSSPISPDSSFTSRPVRMVNSLKAAVAKLKEAAKNDEKTGPKVEGADTSGLKQVIGAFMAVIGAAAAVFSILFPPATGPGLATAIPFTIVGMGLFAQGRRRGLATKFDAVCEAAEEYDSILSPNSL